MCSSTASPIQNLHGSRTATRRHEVHARCRAAPPGLAPLVLHLHTQPLQPAAAQAFSRQPPAVVPNAAASALAKDPSMGAPPATDVADAAGSGAATGLIGGPRLLTGDMTSPLMLANLRDGMQVWMSPCNNRPALAESGEQRMQLYSRRQHMIILLDCPSSTLCCPRDPCRHFAQFS